MATRDNDQIFIASGQSNKSDSMQTCSSRLQESPDVMRPPISPTKPYRYRLSSLEDEALFSPLIPTLYEEPTFHGIIRNDTAEQILMNHNRPNGSYLLYMDKCEINRVSICILYNPKHLKQPYVLEGALSFPRQTPSVMLDSTGDTFATIHGLIDYYSQYPIPVENLTSRITFSPSKYAIKLVKGVKRDNDLIRKLSPLEKLLTIDIADDVLMKECYYDEELPYYTSDMTGEIRIRRCMRENLLDPNVPLTIPRLILSYVTTCPEKFVIKYKERGEWEGITYLELFDAALQVAKALNRCGLVSGRGVGLYGGNSPYWIISNLGIIMAGGVSVAISPSTNEIRLKQIALKTNLQFLFVGDLQFFSRVLTILDDVKVEHVILFPPHISSADSRGVDWATFNSRGCGENNDNITRIMRGLKPNKCCTILFSSGTTGAPKGVMLSHDNITRHLTDSIKFFNLRKYTGGKTNRTLNYFPLSTTLAHMSDIYFNLMMKGTLYIIHPTSWLDLGLVDCLKEVRPTFIIAGENFWMGIYRHLSLQVEQSGYLMQKFTSWAEDMTEKQATLENKNLKHKLFFSAVRTLFVERLANKLGLNECKTCCSTYAPLPREVFDFLVRRNIFLLNIYGMTEATATVASTASEDVKLTDGRIMSEIDYYILMEPGDEHIGEICISGRNIFMGYVDEEQLTQDAFVKIGHMEMPYYKTGDLGRLEENKLTYHGRKIHHIRMQDGERIFPIILEDKLRERLPFVEYVVVLPNENGELISLFTVKVNYNEERDRTRELDAFAAHSCLYHLGINSILDVGAFMSHIQVREFITREIKEMNKEAISKNHCIKTWAFAKEGFSIRTGEITPNYKLRRDVIEKHFIKREYD